MRWDQFPSSCEPPQGDGPGLFPDNNRSQSCSMHYSRCGTKPKHDESARHVLPSWLKAPMRPSNPQKVLPSPTNGPQEYPRFCYRMLLSFRSPPSSANRVVLAVFWKSIARPSSARGFGDCVGQRNTRFLWLRNNPNAGGNLLASRTRRDMTAPCSGKATAGGRVCTPSVITVRRWREHRRIG
jgi:hypothetical protein